MHRTLELVFIATVFAGLVSAFTYPSIPAKSLVNTRTASDQMLTDICASHATATYLVLYNSDGLDGDAEGVAATIFNSADQSTRIAEFHVNKHVTSRQKGGRCAVDADGNYVVVWHSFGQASGSTSNDIFFNVIDALTGATRFPSDILVNSNTTGDQSHPAVTVLADLRVLITFFSDWHVKAVTVHATSGAAVGGEVVLHHQQNGVAMSTTELDVASVGVFALVTFASLSAPSDTSLHGVVSVHLNVDDEKSSPTVVSSLLVADTLRVSGSQHHPRMRAMANGTALVTFVDAGNNPDVCVGATSGSGSSSAGGSSGNGNGRSNGRRFAALSSKKNAPTPAPVTPAPTPAPTPIAIDNYPFVYGQFIDVASGAKVGCNFKIAVQGTSPTGLAVFNDKFLFMSRAQSGDVTAQVVDAATRSLIGEVLTMPADTYTTLGVAYISHLKAIATWTAPGVGGDVWRTTVTAAECTSDTHCTRFRSSCFVSGYCAQAAGLCQLENRTGACAAAQLIAAFDTAPVDVSVPRSRRFLVDEAPASTAVVQLMLDVPVTKFDMFADHVHVVLSKSMRSFDFLHVTVGDAVLAMSDDITSIAMTTRASCGQTTEVGFARQHRSRFNTSTTFTTAELVLGPVATSAKCNSKHATLGALVTVKSPGSWAKRVSFSRIKRQLQVSTGDIYSSANGRYTIDNNKAGFGRGAQSNRPHQFIASGGVRDPGRRP